MADIKTQGGSECYVVAETYAKAKEQIFKMYGTGAQITRHETVAYGGFLGFGKKLGIKMYCIPSLATINAVKRPAAVGAPPQPQSRPVQHIPQTVPSLEETKKKVLETVPNSVMNDIQLKELLKRMEYLTGLVQENNRASVVDHASIVKIEKMLEENEFSVSYIRDMSDRIRREFSIEDLESFNLVQETVVTWIGASVKIGEYFSSRNEKTYPQVVVLVGPTGVGKTTTIAKLAAHFVMPSQFNNQTRRRVRLITADTYRIKAVDQLQAYGSYMDVPVSTSEKLEDLEQIISTFRDSTDMFFVDTCGLSPDDFDKLGALRSHLNVHGIKTEVFLTVSATTKASDLRDIIQKFEIFDYSSVILTKIDETNKLGNAISAFSEKGKSVSILTTGQSVPNDICRAEVMEFLKRLDGFKISRERLNLRFPPVQTPGEE